MERFSAEQYGVWASLTAALRTGMPQCDKSMVNNFAPLYADETSRDALCEHDDRKDAAGGEGAGEPHFLGPTTAPSSTSAHRKAVCRSKSRWPIRISPAARFDLPPLAPLFDSYVQEHALSDRLRFYPGDFFNDPLPSADVLVIGRVLHNWDLATKMMLLKKAYDALPPAGALIVYERLIDDDRRVNAAGLLSSLQMLLASTGGFDFTGADCIGWMREIGFRDIRVEPLTADQSMVVGIK